MSLLEIKDLKVHFPIKRGVLIDRTIGHVQAVDGVSLCVEKGQTYGLVGESGCGKTTLGRAVLRLNQITDGEVWFGGRDLAGLDPESMRRERANLQMVFQDPLGSLNPRQTIGAILMEGLETHGIGGPEEFPDPLPPGTDLAVVPDADHGFKVPKRSPITQDDAMGIVVEAALEWIVREIVGNGGPR